MGPRLVTFVPKGFVAADPFGVLHLLLWEIGRGRRILDRVQFRLDAKAIVICALVASIGKTRRLLDCRLRTPQLAEVLGRAADE